MEASYTGMKVGRLSITFGSQTQTTMMDLRGDLTCLTSNSWIIDAFFINLLVQWQVTKKIKISRSKIMSLETNAMQFPACRFGKAKDYKQMTGQRRRLEISWSLKRDHSLHGLSNHLKLSECMNWWNICSQWLSEFKYVWLSQVHSSLYICRCIDIHTHIYI